LLEPRFGELEITEDGGLRDAQGVGGFGGGQAPEVDEFDELAFSGIDLVEFAQKGVDDQDVEGRFGCDQSGFVEGDLAGAASAFGAIAGAGVVDQDLAHGAGGDSEEVGAVFEIDGCADELDVGFVDEGGGAKGLIAPGGTEAIGGEGFQLGMDVGQERVKGLFVALAGTVKEFRQGEGGWGRRRRKQWIHNYKCSMRWPGGALSLIMTNRRIVASGTGASDSPRLAPGDIMTLSRAARVNA